MSGNSWLKICLVLFSLVSCKREYSETVIWVEGETDVTMQLRKSDINMTEQSFKDAGLIDVHILDSTILVDLRYGTANNFMGIDFYNGLNKCYLQRPVAEMLVKAQQSLKRRGQGLSLVVWDAARPLSVQQKMWDLVVPPPGMFKGYFVSNPARGSIHNYGCAVDVTLADKSGNLLDMGTDFDHFGPEAYPVEEARMLKDAKLTEEQVRNRKLLRSVMYEAGFWTIQTEWWHFNAMRREAASERFSIIR